MGTSGGHIRFIWDANLLGVAQKAQPPSTTSILPLASFDWVSPCVDNGDHQDKDMGLMFPRGLARVHPAGPMLLQYDQDDCPVDARRRWSKAEIMAAAERGPHISALAPEAIAMMHTEVEAKVKGDFAEVIYLDVIEDVLGDEEWTQLKISPLAMIPHKSRKFRAILDLSFGLKVFWMEIPSVNEATHITAPQHSMRNLGYVLPHLIAAVAAAPDDEGDMVFSKLDIKDGFWRMIVHHGQYLNLLYVLPDVPGARIWLVIPSSLQMG